MAMERNAMTDEPLRPGQEVLEEATHTSAKRPPAPRKYHCPVCNRLSQYGGPCGSTCRERATPEQAKPLLGNVDPRWDAKP